MPTTDAILDVLRGVPDPEMPISIVDLGIVDGVRIDNGNVSVDVLPTFVGCPALEMIADDVKRVVNAMEGVSGTTVRFLYDPPWTVDRISETGRASLREHGVTVPDRCDVPISREAAVEFRVSAVRCPFCDSSETSMESPFGPTRCRMIYYCRACRNAFEHLKRLDVGC